MRKERTKNIESVDGMKKGMGRPKRKKAGGRVALSLLACLAAVLLTACGKGSGTTDLPTPVPTGAADGAQGSGEEAEVTEKPSGPGGEEPDGEEGQQPTKAPAQTSSELPKISWRLAEPLYEKKDAVVYGYSITDFGIEPNTGEDVSGKIQAAILLLNRAGGGTFYMPAGEYVLEKTINVPKGVTICGDWKEPVAGEEKVEGTVLKVYAGRGKAIGTAQFILQPNSCVRDLTVWYPEQTVEDIQPYPATFQLYDPSVWGADYTHVNNVTLAWCRGRTEAAAPMYIIFMARCFPWACRWTALRMSADAIISTCPPIIG